MKNSEQHFLPLHAATLWQQLPVDAFSEVFEREASSVEDKSLQQKDTKRRKREGQKNNNCWFSHDVTKFQTSELLILLIFYFHDV